MYTVQSALVVGGVIFCFLSVIILWGHFRRLREIKADYYSAVRDLGFDCNTCGLWHATKTEHVSHECVWNPTKRRLPVGEQNDWETGDEGLRRAKIWIDCGNLEGLAGAFYSAYLAGLAAKQGKVDNHTLEALLSRMTCPKCDSVCDPTGEDPCLCDAACNRCTNPPWLPNTIIKNPKTYTLCPHGFPDGCRCWHGCTTGGG